MLGTSVEIPPEDFHRAIFVPHDPQIESHWTGHLMYDRKRGVKKTEAAKCSECKRLGLDDLQWHEFDDLGQSDS